MGWVGKVKERVKVYEENYAVGLGVIGEWVKWV